MCQSCGVVVMSLTSGYEISFSKHITYCLLKHFVTLVITQFQTGSNHHNILLPGPRGTGFCMCVCLMLTCFCVYIVCTCLYMFICLWFLCPLFKTSARHIKVVRPMYGAEVFDGETARFEVELSEDDVHGQWKLNGELLSPSTVCHCISADIHLSVVSFFYLNLDVDTLVEINRSCVLITFLSLSQFCWKRLLAICRMLKSWRTVPNILWSCTTAEYLRPARSCSLLLMPNVLLTWKWRVSFPPSFFWVSVESLCPLRYFDFFINYLSESTEVPVSFITPLADVHVYEKDEAKFELEISREPKSFRWLKGSQELSTDDKFELHVEGKRHSLFVKSARYEDEGKYMFEAEDKRTAGKLIIKGKQSWISLVFLEDLFGYVAEFFFCVLAKLCMPKAF